MSGLAVVAQALGASVTGSDRAAGSPYAATLAAAGIEPVLGHDAANVPEGAEVVYSSAIPESNPERARAGAAPRGPARRDHAPEADDRRLRHPRQDHHLEHARARAGRRLLPGRGRGPQHRVQRRLGAGGVARGRGRRVRSQPAQALADDRGRHQRRARPPHDLCLLARRRRHVPRLPGPRAGTGGPAGAGAAGGAPDGLRRRGRPPVRAGRAQRPQRRGGADGDPARGRRRRRRRPPAGELRGRGPPLRAARHHRERRRTGRRLRAPPDRGRRDDRGRAHARAPARARLLSAAPVLAHAARGDRLRSRRWPPPTWP